MYKLNDYEYHVLNYIFSNDPSAVYTMQDIQVALRLNIRAQTLTQLIQKGLIEKVYTRNDIVSSFRLTKDALEKLSDDKIGIPYDPANYLHSTCGNYILCDSIFKYPYNYDGLIAINYNLYYTYLKHYPDKIEFLGTKTLFSVFPDYQPAPWAAKKNRLLYSAILRNRNP